MFSGAASTHAVYLWRCLCTFRELLLADIAMVLSSSLKMAIANCGDQIYPAWTVYSEESIKSAYIKFWVEDDSNFIVLLVLIWGL